MTPLDIREDHGHLWIETALHSLIFGPVTICGTVTPDRKQCMGAHHAFLHATIHIC